RSVAHFRNVLVPFSVPVSITSAGYYGSRLIQLGQIALAQQQAAKPEPLLGADVLLQRTGEAVAETHDFPFARRNLQGGADVLQLADHMLERTARPQPQRDH